MRISAGQFIAGLPAKSARELLRRSRPFTGVSASAIREWLGEKGLAHADQVIASLVREGYLEPVGPDGVGMTIGDPPWWRNTIQGNALCLASAASPVTRMTAERHLAALIERAKAINKNPEYLYWVESLAVFGSYLDQAAKRLGDLDVAVRLRPRSEGPDFRRKCEERALRSGRAFPTYLDFLFWPEHEVLMLLKHGSRVLSLHNADHDEVVNGAKLSVVYSR